MKYYITSVFLCFTIYAFSNIIGGELNYQLIDSVNFSYKITLEMYDGIDDPYSLGYDPPPTSVKISLYDTSSNLLDVFSINRDTIFDLTTNLNYNCTAPAIYTVVKKMIFDTIIQLTPISGGYNLVYSRCCFSSFVNNLLTPVNEGLTFMVHLVDTSVVKYNNTPNFKDHELFIFDRQDSITIDMSANDIDGDSLVYRFITPYDYNLGAPPYLDTIQWMDIGQLPASLEDLLAVDNALAQGVPLKINTSTGLITGRTGNYLGKYLIPVEVSEYRNNIFLDKKIYCFKLALDYIDTVLVPHAIIDSIDFLNKCDDSTVIFDNHSSYFDDIFWDFGDSTTSMEYYTTHTYSDTGEFTVRLVVIQYAAYCSDTVYKKIKINNNSLNADFKVSGGECIFSPLQYSDKSNDAYYEIIDWFWDFGDTKTSTLQNPPTHQFYTLGTYDVSLTVKNNVGCESTTTIPSKIFTQYVPDIIEDQTIAYGSNTQLDVYDGIFYRWEPNYGLIDDTLINNPIVNPKVTTTYTVNVLSEDSCWAKNSVTVNVFNNFVPNAFSPNGDGFNDQVKIRNTGLLSMQFNVFDKRGIRIFHGESPNDYWDGKLNGNDLPAGVYAYVLELHFNGELTQFFKGNITLIR